MEDILTSEYRDFKGNQRSTQILQDYCNKMVKYINIVVELARELSHFIVNSEKYINYFKNTIKGKEIIFAYLYMKEQFYL